VTVEEALVTLLAAVAGVMLFLGLAQALEDRPPRRVSREPEAPTRSARRAPAPAPARPAPSGPAPWAAPAEGSGQPGPRAIVDRAQAIAGERALSPDDEETAAVRGDSAPIGPAQLATAGHARSAAAIHAEPGGPGDSERETAPAVSGEPTAAVSDAAGHERPPGLGDQQLSRVRRAAPPAAGAEGGLAAVPAPASAVGIEDGGIADVRARAATELIARSEFAEARRFIGGAIDAGELPATRGQALLDDLSRALRREVGRLTSGAVRGSADEASAVSALERARALLDTMPNGSLPALERPALARRIWQAHAKLGFRRLRLGQLDAAAEALFSALAMREIGPRGQRQVRDALVRTLEGMAAERAVKGAALLAEGRREAAAEALARIEERIDRARAEGVPAEELEVALARARQLALALGGVAR
jgi:hypothetical protein